MLNSDHILLYIPEDESKNVRISTYEKWCSTKDKISISDFIYERHYRRYIKPFEFDDQEFIKSYKNGFAMMANCCLLIETIESFYRGWEKSKNEINFLKFFTREKGFSEFATDDMPTQFYKHIRCGILHQGETTGGWKIRRKGSRLLEKMKLEINAFIFALKLKESLKSYQMNLRYSDWDSEIWLNLREKMKSIIKNCK